MSRKIFVLITLMTCLFFSIYIHSATKDKMLKKWINEFQPSTLSKDKQRKELNWIINAAKPYKGMQINVVSEIIATHIYEAKVLAKAFTELTGIHVVHELTGEDDVVKKISTQMNTDFILYDGFISDSDLIGLYYRNNAVVNLKKFMDGSGKDVTLPTLDINDFIGINFTSIDPKKEIYQLPDQQFANLYWYRHDWFSRADLKASFKKIYGYELNVPVNWSAYEDIAEFFTKHVKEIDGQRVYGHMDYGKRDPSLGWRFSDAWLSMAGTGDKGLPNGKPVDEWGVRMEDCRPVAATIARGGATNSAAAIYALNKFIKWLNEYAPPEAKNMTFSEAGPIPSQGHIAQQIFWYTAFTAAMIKPGLPITNQDGTPKWRMAPSPHGAYWETGMKLGYQDAGSWTFTKNTPVEKMKAAWLYAQFVVSKTVSLKKSLKGLTFIRKSDIYSPTLTKQAYKFGGLVEFYQSNARTRWTPTGINIPDYPNMAHYWWRNTSLAIAGNISAKEAMNNLAKDFEKVFYNLTKKENINKCSPKLNPKKKTYWLKQAGSPKPKLINENPKGITMSYENIIKLWSK